MVIYTYEIDGLPIKTGDIICTTETEGNILPGEFWRLLGRLRQSQAPLKGLNPYTIRKILGENLPFVL